MEEEDLQKKMMMIIELYHSGEEAVMVQKKHFHLEEEKNLPFLLQVHRNYQLVKEIVLIQEIQFAQDLEHFKILVMPDVII